MEMWELLTSCSTNSHQEHHPPKYRGALILVLPSLAEQNDNK